MSSEPFKPEIRELKYFLAASIVIGAAYAAYSGSFTPKNSIIYLGVSVMILLLRELGQRTIAQLMDADVELKLSLKGSIVTVFGAFISILTVLPVIMIFPIYNEFSTQRYEQWGKSVDVVWLKRKFWLVSGGIVFLFLGWLTTYFLGLTRAAEAFSLFIIFQLMPFDYHSIPTGSLDGATILKQSGFTWLVFTGIAWSTLVLTWV